MQQYYIQRYDPYDNALYHHGILGQKWGIRRYQNEDGSLTDEGKKRYLKNSRKFLDENGTGELKLNNKDHVKALRKDLETYKYDTYARAEKEVIKRVDKDKSMKGVKLKSNLAGATLAAGAAIVGTLMGMPFLGATGVYSGSQLSQELINMGREDVAQALGYETLADMTVEQYNKYAAAAKRPNYDDTNLVIGKLRVLEKDLKKAKKA